MAVLTRACFLGLVCALLGVTALCQSIVTLESARPISQTIRPGEQHIYVLQLAAGEFARIEIDCAGTGIGLALFDSTRQKDWGDDQGAPPPWNVVFYAPTVNLYQIRLTADKGPISPQHYRLRWMEKRPATELDKAEVNARQTDYEAALLYNKQSPEAYRLTAEKCRAAAHLYEIVGARHDRGRMFNLLGLSLHALGERAAAEQSYQQSLAIFRSLGQRHKESNVLNNLSGLSVKWGDYQAALDYAGQALLIARQDNDLPRLMSCLNRLAEIYRSSGELKKAIDLNQEVVALARANPTVVYAGVYEVQGLLGLGQNYFDLGDETQGLRSLEEGLALHQQRNLALAAHIVAAQAARAAIYLRRGAATTALNLLLSTLAEHQLTSYPRATVLTRLGQSYLALARYEESQDAFAKAVALSQTSGFQDLSIEALLGLARVARARQQLHAAITWGEQSIAIIEQQQANIYDATLRATLFATQRAVYELQIELLMQLSEQTPARRTELQAAALHLSERSRARTLLNLLISPATPMQTVADQRQLREKLEATATAINKTAFTNQPRRDELNRALTVLTTELNLQYTANRKPVVATNLVQALTWSEIQQQVLDENTLLLEFALGTERSYLFAVAPTHLQTFILPPRAEIEQQARALHQLMELRAQPPVFKSIAAMQQWKAQTQAQYAQIARRLSQTLLAPVGDLLPNKRLLIVPDGALHYVPFAALPVVNRQSLKTTDNEQPLIVKHEILMLSSASTLAVQRRRAVGRVAAPKILALLADPVFSSADPRLPDSTRASAGNTSEPQLARLRAAQQEAEALIALVPPEARMVAMGTAANLTTASSAVLEQYRYVHIATHGIFDNEHPELSSLVFSQRDEKGAAQNGHLRAIDSFHLRLNAELVVLSGC
ncbi:MAG: CHAT domain-containing protein, partial [Blastocatellia bacterium]|nr:CHAT domain-containing protein [Blastocatellia bacterium]